MDEHQEMRGMRASDADRQDVVSRLRTAMDEGRLSIDEFTERMGHAYEARTYGELAPLTSDLPQGRAVQRPAEPGRAEPGRAVQPAPPAPQADTAATGWFAGLPAPLRVMWTIWSIAVSVNIVVWALVCATTAQLVYPWPVWVAGPWGAVLVALSAASRRGRRPPPPGSS